MTKSILVIDTPPCCEDCPCSTLVKAPQKTREAYCELCEKFNNRIMTKPEWCPLKPMPTKKEVEVNDIEDIMHQSFEDIYTKHIVTVRLATDKLISLGWNACIDELEGK